ncbi:hypothetical protein [Leptospira sp. GIMC2001]|uniref:hypothetical protein n=1 Tax=Leptospira sp. GIMC2001 TaxID=1513297 RepID=UPI002349B488|nr:hypothetical protein [Leptospira sp. GIMC2001]WCL50530.1 hypothetical protein O4O04_06840 [Leptospira sp. GIMC2001]
MKKLSTVLAFAILALSLNPHIWAQAEGGPTGGDSTASVNNEPYYPLAYFDPRIKLKKVSFVRRHADTGKGEFLDVQIELESKVMQAHNYSIYVIAVHERDSQNDDERQLVPYPSWRPFNPKAIQKRVTFSNIMPANVPSKEIWGEETYNKRQEEVDKQILRGYNAEIGEPNFDEYMRYLTMNPGKALPFTLYGEEGPAKDKILVHNYTGQTPDEKKGWRHETLKDHTYTLYSNKYQSTIITHHYTQYRPNFLTFNKIGILIFDPNKEKNNLLVRRIVDIGDLKMTY